MTEPLKGSRGWGVTGSSENGLEELAAAAAAPEAVFIALLGTSGPILRLAWDCGVA